MIVRQRWGSAVILAVLLHIFVLGGAGVLLPEGKPLSDGAEEITWLDVSEANDEADHIEPAAEAVPQIVAEEELTAEAAPPPEPLTPPAKETAKTSREGEKKPTVSEKAKPQPKRDYPAMRKPNKPAVLQPETKRGLTEKETPYKGRAQFFVDVSREGRVTGIQAWQFEPKIADEKERRLLEEQLTKRIRDSWRYMPSLTPEGVPTTQTKSEELDIPERQQPKDVP